MCKVFQNHGSITVLQPHSVMGYPQWISIVPELEYEPGTNNDGSDPMVNRLSELFVNSLFNFKLNITVPSCHLFSRDIYSHS